jgi:hypothetical protein
MTDDIIKASFCGNKMARLKEYLSPKTKNNSQKIVLK